MHRAASKSRRTPAIAARRRRASAQLRATTINLRAPAPIKALIDRAAQIAGKTRSEFMLDSVRRSAEDVVLDQRLFSLDAGRYAAFVKLLDRPPRPWAALKQLLAAKAPWET